MRETYHDHGFAKVAASSYGIDDTLIATLLRHGAEANRANEEIWTVDPKNQNTLTLRQSLIQDNAGLYIDLLVGTGLHAILEAITGRTLFMTNLMHMISGQSARTLRWHRDSYRHKNRWIGPLPPPIKCAVFLTRAGADSSVTGFIKGSHRFDPKNIYLDFLAATLITPLQVFPTVLPGDAVEFDGSIIHCRRKPKKGLDREAIIFSLTSDHDGQSPYIEDHRPVIDAFNDRIAGAS
jgi:hypothetical protein